MQTAFVPIYTEEELLKKIKSTEAIILKTKNEVLQSTYSEDSYLFGYVWCAYELVRYVVSDFLDGDYYEWYDRLFIEKEVDDDYVFEPKQLDTLHNSLIALKFEYNQFRDAVSQYYDYHYVENGKEAVTFIITDIFLKINPETDDDYQKLAYILEDLNRTYISCNDDYTYGDEVTWEQMFDYVDAYLEHQEDMIVQLKTRLDLEEA